MSKIDRLRQRLGARTDTLRKTVSGPVRKDIGKFKSKQKFDSIVRDKEQQEFYGDVLEKGGPRLDVEGIDPAMDELRAGDPMAVQLDFESMPYGSKQNKKGVISWKQTKKTIPPSRVEGTSPVPDYELSEDGGGLVELPSKDSELGEKLRAERRDNKFNVYPTSRTKGRGTSITKRNAEKWAKLKQRIAQVRLAVDYTTGLKSRGPDMDAIRAFIKKKPYTSGKNHRTGSNFKYRSDGQTLFLHDTAVAKHSKDGGYDITNGTYDTPLTSLTHNALGIPSLPSKRNPKGLATLGSKEVSPSSGEWVHVPQNEVQSKPVVYPKKTSSRSVSRSPAEQSKFYNRIRKQELKERGLKKGLPPAKTNIQPEDQDAINKITGLNTKIYHPTLGTEQKKVLGTEAHHILPTEENREKLDIESSGIMLPSDYHTFITNFEKSKPKTNLRRLKQMQSKLRLKIARIRQRNISRINIAQKSVMNLREKRVSDIRRDWKKQEANIKKYADGFTMLDGDVLDLNQGAHLQKILDKYPGKGHVYIVSSLGGGKKPVKSIDSPEVDIGFDAWKKLKFTPQAGGYKGDVEMNALFRAEDNEQAKAFTEKFDQQSYTEVRPDGTFDFYDRYGNPAQ